MVWIMYCCCVDDCFIIVIGLLSTAYNVNVVSSVYQILVHTCIHSHTRISFVSGSNVTFADEENHESSQPPDLAQPATPTSALTSAVPRHTQVFKFGVSDGLLSIVLEGRRDGRGPHCCFLRKGVPARVNPIQKIVVVVIPSEMSLTCH